MKWVNENSFNGVIIPAGAWPKVPVTSSLHRACSTCTSTRPSTGMSKATTSCWRLKGGLNSWTLVCNVPPFWDVLSWHCSFLINKNHVMAPFNTRGSNPLLWAACQENYRKPPISFIQGPKQNDTTQKKVADNYSFHYTRSRLQFCPRFHSFAFWVFLTKWGSVSSEPLLLDRGLTAGKVVLTIYWRWLTIISSRSWKPSCLFSLQVTPHPLSLCVGLNFLC